MNVCTWQSFIYSLMHFVALRGTERFERGDTGIETKNQTVMWERLMWCEENNHAWKRWGKNFQGRGHLSLVL